MNNKIKQLCLSLVTVIAAIFIPLCAMAATTAAQPSLGEAIKNMLPMFVIFIAVFYFLAIRPQTKKRKEHGNLMSSLSQGDEVTTTGGIIAKIKSLDEQYALLVLSCGSEMMIQRASIASLLPKGTLDSFKK
jgi:preprotein translocase subunit YajC